MYEPSDRVIKVVSRPKWKTNDGFIDRNVTLIVTQNVVVSIFNSSLEREREREINNDKYY
jgi:hypothetical protein